MKKLIFLGLFLAFSAGAWCADTGDIPSDLSVGAGQSVRRNAGDTAFEAFTPSSGGDSITVNTSSATDPDFANGDIDWTLTGGNSITATVACSGCVDATDLGTDSVSADELSATGVESELESVLDLSDLQGAVTDAQVPNNITIDSASAVEGVDLGTLTDTKVCTYDSANTEIDCDTTPSGGVSDGDKGDITVSGGGSTWVVDNLAISTSKINWSSIVNLELQSSGFNWLSVPAEAIQRSKINWSNLETDSASGINWGSISGALNGYVLKKTASGINWQPDLTGGGTIDGSGTNNELSYWVDSDTLGALAVATYPSLTELSYLKGATSSVQTQINAKESSTSNDFDPDRLAGDTTDNNLIDESIIDSAVARDSELHSAVTVSDTAEIDLTVTGQQVSGSLVASSIDETKLDASVNASLDLADSALQAEVDGSTTNELQNIFQTVDAPSGTDPIADSTTDTLTLSASGIVTITGDSTTDTITIGATEVDGSTTNEIEVVDEAYSSANFNGATAQAVSQDDFYDYNALSDSDDDGLIEKVDTTTNGFVKTTGANGTLSIDTSTYLTAEVDGSTTNELQNIFQTISTTSGTSPVADSTTDTLTVTAGTGITVTGDSSTDTLTIASTVVDTNANTICAGTTTYLDGEGNCDDISSAYETADADIAKVNESETITGDWDIGGGTLQIPNGTTLPASCEVGDQFMDTDATTGQRHYLCESTNTWALQGGGGGGDSVSVDGGAVVDPNFASTGDIDFVNTSNTVTANINSAVIVDGDIASSQDLMKASIGYIIDGGGSVITTGEKGCVEVPFNMTITGWTITSDVSGSIAVDVWKDTYANFPPTVGDTIAGTEKPTLSSAQKNQDTSLSTWTTTVTDGDHVCFNVDSASTVKRATVMIRGNKT